MSGTKQTFRAGLVLYRIVEGRDWPNNIEMMFMVPSDPAFGGPDPQIPKGRIDPGENAREAALREAKEEVGLFTGSLIGEVDELGTFLGRTTIFIGKVLPEAMFGDPTYETGETRWLTLEQFMEIGRPLHKPVVKAAHRHIIKRETAHLV
jgi:8-oxo-dGTP pyrophosphatase MutT (NUDIX family)